MVIPNALSGRLIQTGQKCGFRHLSKFSSSKFRAQGSSGSGSNGQIYSHNCERVTHVMNLLVLKFSVWVSPMLVWLGTRFIGHNYGLEAA